MRLQIALLTGVLATAAVADLPYLYVEGETVYFDTGAAPSGWGDVEEEFALLLMEHPEVMQVSVTGPGGDYDAAMRMAFKIREFGLSTIATGTCDSACATLFVAGYERVLMPDAELGFHRIRFREESSRAFYESQVELLGDAAMPPYAEWLYQDAQHQAGRLLLFYTSAGIDPIFTSQLLLTDSSAMWVPPRTVLIDFGVVSD